MNKPVLHIYRNTPFGRETLFDRTMEKVQSGLPNSLLVVGPKCSWV